MVIVGGRWALAVGVPSTNRTTQIRMGLLVKYARYSAAFFRVFFYKTYTLYDVVIVGYPQFSLLVPQWCFFSSSFLCTPPLVVLLLPTQRTSLASQLSTFASSLAPRNPKASLLSTVCATQIHTFFSNSEMFFSLTAASSVRTVPTPMNLGNGSDLIWRR